VDIGRVEISQVTNSRGVQDLFFGDPFDLRDRPEDGIESAESKRMVVRDGQTVRAWKAGFQDDMTTLLIDDLVSMMFAEELDQISAAEIAR
jgi:hypothetical protein